MIKTAEVRITKRIWLEAGMSSRFAIGFSIDRYYINLDLVCFFFTVQL